MKKQNQSPTERMRKLDPKLVDKVKPLKEHPEIVAERDKLIKLKADLAAVEKKISLHYEGPAQAEAIPQIEQDARKLLAGEQLTGISRETEIKNLHRERDGLLRAVIIQESKIQDLTMKLARAVCREHNKDVEKYAKAVILAWEQVKTALENTETVLDFFSERGFTARLRPAQWVTTGYEEIILHGGMNVTMPALDFHLEQRRKAWGLESKK